MTEQQPTVKELVKENAALKASLKKLESEFEDYKAETEQVILRLKTRARPSGGHGTTRVSFGG